MPEKHDLVSYMTGLIGVMESREQAGIARGNTLGIEYNLQYNKLMDIIRKEHEDARKSERHDDALEGSHGGETGIGPRSGADGDGDEAAGSVPGTED